MGSLWLLVVVMVGNVRAGRVVVTRGGCREYRRGWAIAG